VSSLERSFEFASVLNNGTLVAQGYAQGDPDSPGTDRESMAQRPWRKGMVMERARNLIAQWGSELAEPIRDLGSTIKEPLEFVDESREPRRANDTYALR
jgi:hypothetical protein